MYAHIHKVIQRKTHCLSYMTVISFCIYFLLESTFFVKKDVIITITDRLEKIKKGKREKVKDAQNIRNLLSHSHKSYVILSVAYFLKVNYYFTLFC